MSVETKTLLEEVLNYFGLERNKVIIFDSKKTGYLHIVVSDIETISLNYKLRFIWYDHKLIPLKDVLVC